MKVIAIGGEPGVGKSTLIKSILNDTFKYVKEGLVKYHQNKNVYILGEYGSDANYAQGTDKMSMACQPKVQEFLTQLPDDSIVIFEGDRLFNNSFLTFCNDRFDLKIIILDAEEEVKKQRYKDRGSEQNETWLSGRKTKVSNISQNLEFFDIITTYPHNTNSELNSISNFIKEQMNDSI